MDPQDEAVESKVEAVPDETEAQYEDRIINEEKTIADLEKKLETDELFQGLDIDQAQAQHAEMKTDEKHFQEVQEQKKKPSRRRQPPAKKRNSTAPAPEDFEDQVPTRPPPKKRRKTTTKAFTQQAKEAKNSEDTRKDKTYQTLAAYGRSALLSPVLEQNGYSLSPHALRQIPSELLQPLLEEVEEVLDNHSTDDTSNFMIMNTMKHIEKIIAYKTAYKIQGTTDKCFTNSRWLFNLERAKLKLGIGISKLPLALEMTILTITIAAEQNSFNKISALKETLTEDAPTDIPDAPSDLD
jgi:hypothetical protein